MRLPPGQLCVVTAYASFQQVARLFPVIDGEPVEQIMVAASVGEPSTTILITKSGKEVPVSQLSVEDQRQVALAIDAFR